MSEPERKLTTRQAIIVSAYTGYLVCDFAVMHSAIEQKLGRPVFTHEMPAAWDEIRAAFKSDFLSLAP